MRTEIITVKICKDFYNQWIKAMADFENINIDEAEVFYGHHLKDLANNISGKEVVINKNIYDSGGVDYFEDNDNNIMIFRRLFRIL